MGGWDAGCLAWEDEQYHGGPGEARSCGKKRSARLTPIRRKEIDMAFAFGCEKIKKHSLCEHPAEKLRDGEKSKDM